MRVNWRSIVKQLDSGRHYHKVTSTTTLFKVERKGSAGFHLTLVMLGLLNRRFNAQRLAN